MTEYEYFSLIISGLTTLTALSGVIYAGFQLRQSKKYLELTYNVHVGDHDWNRRLAAQNALKEYNQSVITSGLQKEFNYLNRKESIPLDEVEEKFKIDPVLQNELHQMLNYYEGLARGIFQRIYDEEVIKTGRRRAMSKALRAFNAYIENRRTTMNSPSAWCDLESINAKWAHESRNINLREQTNARLQWDAPADCLKIFQ